MTTAEHPLIVVEGNQGTGKSTLAAHLAAQLGGAVVHFPDGFLAMRQTIALDDVVESLPRLLYYQAATLHLADIVRWRRTPVVCDRWAASPISLLVADGAAGAAEVRRWREHDAYLPRPHVTLLLVCTHAVAARRIGARADARPLTVVERRTLDSLGFFRARAHALAEHAAHYGDVVTIDTSRRGIEDVREQALAAIAPFLPHAALLT